MNAPPRRRDPKRLTFFAITIQRNPGPNAPHTTGGDGVQRHSFLGQRPVTSARHWALLDQHRRPEPRVHRPDGCPRWTATSRKLSPWRPSLSASSWSSRRPLSTWRPFLGGSATWSVRSVRATTSKARATCGSSASAAAHEVSGIARLPGGQCHGRKGSQSEGLPVPTFRTHNGLEMWVRNGRRGYPLYARNDALNVGSD